MAAPKKTAAKKSAPARKRSAPAKKVASPAKRTTSVTVSIEDQAMTQAMVMLFTALSIVFAALAFWRYN